MCPANIRELELKRILVVGFSSLSGNLLLTPSIRKIKEVFPGASLDIIAGRDSSDLFMGNPLFSCHIPFDNWRGIPGLVKRARVKRYDLIVSFSSHYLPFLLRGKYKLSFFWRDLFSEKVFTHESERLLAFIEPFFGREERKGGFFSHVTRQSRECVDDLLRASGIRNSDTLVVVNPGFTPSSRRFSPGFYTVIASDLARVYGAKIVITGSENDESAALEIMGGVKDGEVFDFTGRLGLKEMAALIEKADLLVSQETVPIYLACSAKCAVAAVFGPGNSYRYGPIGTKNLVVHSRLECFPCSLQSGCRKGNACLLKITPEQVSKSAMLLIDEKEQPFLFEL